MSWQPPPSFDDRGATDENKKSPRKSTSKSWAPAFVVGGGEPPAPTSFLQPSNTGTEDGLEEPVISLSRKSANTIVPESPGVSWNVDLVNVKQDSVVSRSSSLHQEAASKFLSVVTKTKHEELVDKATLQTRIEWTRLLISKAFKPYKKMICAIDDDLVDPSEVDQIDAQDDDEWDDDDALSDIRNRMLDDPDLTEREIACFFEGFRLLQLKINSLKTQLEGAKTMQRLQNSAQSIAASRSLIASRSMMMTRREAQKRNAPKKPASIIGNRGVMNSKSKFTKAENTGFGVAFYGTDSSDDDDSAMIPPSQPRNKNPISKGVREKRQDADSSSSEEEELPPIRIARNATPTRSLRLLSIARIRRDAGNEGNSDVRKILDELEEAEARQRKLEKQLAQAGIVIAEDIPYDVAKEKCDSIAARMAEIGNSDIEDKALREEYFNLERDLEKSIAALQLTDEWAEEQEEMERQWEESVAADNEEAVKKLRRHMPVNVRNMSESALSTQPGPRGKALPKDIAKKFKRTNVLQILRLHPEDILPMHPSTLENMRVTGLTLTERRALYHHLKEIGPRWKAMQNDKMVERKWNWFNMMKTNFRENLAAWNRHVVEYGPPGEHPYATRENPNEGCPLIGKQCPLRADKQIDYDSDYGYTEEAEYFRFKLKKSDVDNDDKTKQETVEALREKKALERYEKLKTHYKGRILQVSLANGSCESMDEIMDNLEEARLKWTRERLESSDLSNDSKRKQVAAFNDSLNEFKLSILQVAERSGMQLTGKRDANKDKPDIRSMIEISLCFEVIETGKTFLKEIEEIMEEYKVKDGLMKSMMKQLDTLLDEIFDRNIESSERLGEERFPRSRKLKSSQDIFDEIKKEMAIKKKRPELDKGDDKVGPRSGRGGRGGLLDAIAGGHTDRGGGRGGLMAAIAAGRSGRG